MSSAPAGVPNNSPEQNPENGSKYDPSPLGAVENLMNVITAAARSSNRRCSQTIFHTGGLRDMDEFACFGVDGRAEFLVRRSALHWQYLMLANISLFFAP